MEALKTDKTAFIEGFILLYDLHTTLFSNVIENISEEDAHNRLNTKANHVAWLSGSLVQERFDLANALNIEEQQKANALFEGHKGVQDQLTYPSLASFKEDWIAISPKLRSALLAVSQEKLDSIIPMPDGEMTFFDWVFFIIHRESYCIGQIGLWRRLLGYDAMRYPMEPEKK